MQRICLIHGGAPPRGRGKREEKLETNGGKEPRRRGVRPRLLHEEVTSIARRTSAVGSTQKVSTPVGMMQVYLGLWVPGSATYQSSMQSDSIGFGVFCNSLASKLATGCGIALHLLLTQGFPSFGQQSRMQSCKIGVPMRYIGAILPGQFGLPWQRRS